jgi:hypothetical protein
MQAMALRDFQKIGTQKDMPSPFQSYYIPLPPKKQPICDKMTIRSDNLQKSFILLRLIF